MKKAEKRYKNKRCTDFFLLDTLAVHLILQVSDEGAASIGASLPVKRSAKKAPATRTTILPIR